MVQMEAHTNLDELQLVGQDQMQQVELLGEKVEASKRVSEVQKEEGSKKLYEMSESQELPW